MKLFDATPRGGGFRLVCTLIVGGALLAANVFVQAGPSDEDAASAEVPKAGSSKENPQAEKTDKGKPGEKRPEKVERAPEKSVDKTVEKKPADKKVVDKSPEKGAKGPEKAIVDKTKSGEKRPDKKGEKPGSEEGKPVDKREAAALAFARTHHPELAELLSNLKRGNPIEYQRAIKELSAAVERITRIQERNPERYDFVLNTWKLDSRIRLLTARLVMADNPAQEAELKALVLQRNEVKLRELKLEREKVAARLKNIERDIAELEKDQTGAVQRDLQEVRNHLNEKALQLKKKGGKPGAEKPLDKPGSEKKSKEPSKSDKTEKPAPEKSNPEKIKTKKPESKDAAT
ncbi:MAG: hypothetical protein IT428_17735 [Planctomycetaceae bacterium]|nr:hypothetical protein [Planctomycetaceae bacterium]